MSLKKFLFSFAIFFNFYTNTLAAGYFEPYIGAMGGNFSEKVLDINGTYNGRVINKASSDITGSISGVNIGLRVYEKFWDQFFVGGDFSITAASGSLELDVLTKIGDYTFTIISPGIIVGWDIPTWLLPRIWGGIYPYDQMSLGTSDSSESDKYIGHSYKVGISFDFWIIVGIEFSHHTYSRLNGKKLPYRDTFSGIAMTQEKVYIDQYMLTLSYPFSL